jgi:glycosyltransferase involved in cell wall biosynthesis
MRLTHSTGGAGFDGEAGEPAARTPRRVRLAYLLSHPIQYQSPLLRRIAQEPEIDLTVFFGSDFSIKGYKDKDFGVEVKWDIPLLEGFQHEFLPAVRDNGTEGIFSPISRGIFSRLRNFDALWVHGYATVNQMHGILAANALGIPVLVRSDSQLKDRPRSGLTLAAKSIFFALLRHLVDGVLVSGTLNRDYWRHYMGKDFPLFMLPYAVDNSWFQQQCALAATTRPLLQAELGLAAGRPVILFASKLQTRKLCGDLVTAYAHLIAGVPEAAQPYLLIVGDGEERAALEQQAASLQLTGVRFCGFKNQSEMPRYLEIADVFVLPARHEPWGLIVNEAMNAGCAIIVTDDVGAQPDLITDGVEGCVYPVGDVAALTRALHRILDQPETAAAMGRAALERVNRWSFDADIVGLREALAHITRKIDAGTSTRV